MHIFPHLSVPSIGMHLTVTTDLVAVTKEVSLLAQAHTCHSCSQGISTEVRAWLKPPVLGLQAICNVLRNPCYDLTLTFYMPTASDGTKGDIM